MIFLLINISLNFKNKCWEMTKNIISTSVNLLIIYKGLLATTWRALSICYRFLCRIKQRRQWKRSRGRNARALLEAWVCLLARPAPRTESPASLQLPRPVAITSLLMPTVNTSPRSTARRHLKAPTLLFGGPSRSFPRHLPPPRLLAIPFVPHPTRNRLQSRQTWAKQARLSLRWFKHCSPSRQADFLARAFHLGLPFPACSGGLKLWQQNTFSPTKQREISPGQGWSVCLRPLFQRSSLKGAPQSWKRSSAGRRPSMDWQSLTTSCQVQSRFVWRLI